LTAPQAIRLGPWLAPSDDLEAARARVRARMAAVLQPDAAHVAPWQRLPGVNRGAAEMGRAELGGDMSRFPSSAHLISWACICPRSDESAGKRRSTRIRKGSPWLKTTLVQCAWAAARTKGSYLQAQFHRIRARRGPKKAIIAVAASILTAIYHMLKDGTMYHDLGPNHFDSRSKERQKNRLVKRLADLGYAVELVPLAS